MDAELKKLNGGFDEILPEEEEKKDDCLSMAEAMKAKRMATEKEIENNKAKGESVEERKQRLLAQRDALRRQKEAKRQAELDEFNQNLQSNIGPSSSNVFEDLVAADAKLKKQNAPFDPEMERRRQIYKNVRKEIEQDEKKEKKLDYERKMTALESKVKDAEEEKRRKEQSDRAKASTAEAQKQ